MIRFEPRLVCATSPLSNMATQLSIAVCVCLCVSICVCVCESLLLFLLELKCDEMKFCGPSAQPHNNNRLSYVSRLPMKIGQLRYFTIWLWIGYVTRIQQLKYNSHINDDAIGWQVRKREEESESICAKRSALNSHLIKELTHFHISNFVFLQFSCIFVAYFKIFSVYNDFFYFVGINELQRNRPFHYLNDSNCNSIFLIPFWTHLSKKIILISNITIYIDIHKKNVNFSIEWKIERQVNIQMCNELTAWKWGFPTNS